MRDVKKIGGFGKVQRNSKAGVFDHRLAMERLQLAASLLPLLMQRSHST